MAIATTTALQEVLELYEQGLYLQALRRSETLGPLKNWKGTAARVLGGRLAGTLGAPRLGLVLHFRAWRDDSADAEACYFHAWTVLRRRGPFRAWQWLRQVGELPGAPREILADWYALRGYVCGVLRDFDEAESWLAKAEEIGSDVPFIHVQRAGLLMLEDRAEDAVDAAGRALAIRPWFRPAVQALAHALEQVNRADEALGLLREASERLESGDLYVQRAQLEAERNQFEEARRSFETALEYFPLLEKEQRGAIHAQLADAVYQCGDLEQARRLSAESESPFHVAVAEHLAAATPDQRRVQLAVPFVRQHHVTCAPATLSAVSQFWQMPVEHLELAEKVCYDGTPAYNERQWAEQNGWAAREFTITWESACALVDRGIPFTLTTVETTSAHLQAVIGYDARRGTLLLRDPSSPKSSEMLAQKGLERYKATGPRGMAMVPAGQAELLAGIELPDAELYDRFYALQGALLRHDRDEAQRLADEMETAWPGHRLALDARRALASYDADVSGNLEAIEGLLQQFPEEPRLLLARLSCLEQLARRDDRLTLLARACAEPTADPAFSIQYARELSCDARQQEEVLRLLAKAVRIRYNSAESYYQMGRIHWDALRREEALAVMRLAACLEDKDERFAQAYFWASRYLKRTGEVLAWLKARFDRFGAKSSQPAQTQCWAYCELGQVGEAESLLREALRRRPDDSELMLYAADLAARYGRMETAREWLGKAEGRSHLASWLRTAATVAAYEGSLETALGYWRRVLETEPLSEDAHGAAVELLADLEGRPAAVEHLRQAVERFPHNFALCRLYALWLREEDQAVAEAAVRRLLEVHPADGWSRRELAVHLADQGRFDEAFAEVAAAREIEPNEPPTYTVLGYLCVRAGRIEEAKEAYRAALRLSVDTEVAIQQLVTLSSTPEQRREELVFVYEELFRQVTFGAGLLTWRQQATATLDPYTLLDVLFEALQARPDLWHAWSGVIVQLFEMNHLSQALRLAVEACERFPLFAGAWLDLAQVQRACGDHEGERAALTSALELSPAWGSPARQLAEACERDGDLARSREVLEQAVARSPRDPWNHGCLADVLWRLEEKEAALERLQHSLRLFPGYDWAWGALYRWCHELDRPELVVEAARQETERRPKDARCWIVYARVLVDLQRFDEALEALDRAAQLDPRSTEVHEERALLLARMGRFDDALQACSPDVYAGQPPLELQIRAAWVMQQNGRLEEATDAIRAIVRQSPSHAYAWRLLADWSDLQGDSETYRLASDHFLRLSPQDGVAWGFRADARLRGGDRTGAKADLERALELLPNYEWAMGTLIDLLLDDDQSDEAAQRLKDYKGERTERMLLCQVRVAAAQRKRRDALDALELLCQQAGDGWAIGPAVDILASGRGRGAVIETLEKHLDRDDAPAEVAGQWIRLQVQQRCFGRCRRRLQRLRGREPQWAIAAARYVDALGEAGEKAAFRLFLWRYRRALRDHWLTEAAVGAALTRLSRHRAAVRWMADWPSRPEVEMGSLLFLSLSLRDLGRRHEAGAITLRALELPPDSTARLHRLLAAADRLIEGNPAAAAAQLEQVDPRDLPPYYNCLRGIVQDALPLLQSDEAAPDGYRRLSRKLATILRGRTAGIGPDRLLRELHWRCRQHLAARCGKSLRAGYFSLRAKLSAWL